LERHYLAAPPDYPYSDDLSWLKDRVYSVSRREIDVVREVLPRLKSRFRSMRTCHSTRTEDVGRFYKEGIVQLAPKTLGRGCKVYSHFGACPILNQNCSKAQKMMWEQSYEEDSFGSMPTKKAIIGIMGITSYMAVNTFIRLRYALVTPIIEFENI